MNKLIIASNNNGKVLEIKEMLKDKFEVVSLKDVGIDIDIEETGTTFLENALIKAKAIYDLTGEFVLADDSGLCVTELMDSPGVYSARFAGEKATTKENNALLLKKMKKIKNRSARFESCMVLYYGEDSYIDSTGTCQGVILEKEQKGEYGFGYDPLFYSFELEKPFSICTPQEKNAISHRGRALKQLVDKLNEINKIV